MQSEINENITEIDRTIIDIFFVTLVRSLFLAEKILKHDGYIKTY